MKGVVLRWSAFLAFLFAFVSLHSSCALEFEDDDAALGVGRDMTPEQIEEFKTDFINFDYNKDGFVDAQEVRQGFQHELSDEDLYEFFLDADVDLSGTVSMEEYLDHAIKTSV
uniref:EF-hand domain-containing protein n=1 Tax=Chromera velia CCMP2878 TaxID=1169474 RepID=A0A0G4HZG9_9ALVE|eukprot:Cvel_9698.t1-p1 / transcript=Cvel_9698.t1 / gene=Cvel_9698 / organism=Chromera_velia_CCMP2878 / gene_product=hypothetical protein / transcript_product=hypothetical protein / location=Cvel_scaffold565:42006-43479(-) / protein_length=112 / sequence_SO=supercontig / SO=protein_coding / is_pseudo=false